MGLHWDCYSYQQTDDNRINKMVGKTFVEIKKDEDELTFITEEGEKFVFGHLQDCCESVSIEDICGDLNDLLNTPLLKAEESTSRDNPSDITKDYQDSFTWTFYHFATIKGYVTVRWYGESNGYYSESVDFCIIPPSKSAA